MLPVLGEDVVLGKKGCSAADSCRLLAVAGHEEGEPALQAVL